MATDLADFVGAAVGLNLVFGIPLFPGGLVTAVVAFVILGLQQRGYRPFRAGGHRAAEEPGQGRQRAEPAGPADNTP